MKNFCVLTLMASIALVSSSAFASKFSELKSPKNQALQKISEISKKFSKGSKDSASGIYQVVIKTDARGRSDRKLRSDTLGEVIHRYFGANLDEGIGFKLKASSAAGVAEALHELQDYQGGYEAEFAELGAALEAAVSDSSIELYSGAGGGNNTSAALMGIYDVQNDQIFYLGFSNFGSED